MEELEQILRVHALRYLLMEPTDAVKLIFQNEFGGGHLIRDEERAIAYLRREYASVEHDDAVPREEPIGNGIVRIHLAAIPPEEVEALGRAFIRSAQGHQGSMESFLEKLAVLRNLTGEGVFRFSVSELDDYLADYEKQGYPAVSHSDAYRNAYHPAYRIVTK